MEETRLALRLRFFHTLSPNFSGPVLVRGAASQHGEGGFMAKLEEVQEHRDAVQKTPRKDKGRKVVEKKA
jgi:hypothetical protein